MLKNNTRVPLDKFIEKSLFDKSKGYYMVKNPIGHKGDFITSPNIEWTPMNVKSNPESDSCANEGATALGSSSLTFTLGFLLKLTSEV